eukprot:g2606.t1
MRLSLHPAAGTLAVAVEVFEVDGDCDGSDSIASGRLIGTLLLPFLDHIAQGKHVCDSWWPLLSRHGKKAGEARIALHLSDGDKDADVSLPATVPTASHDHLLFATIERAQSVGGADWLGEMDLSVRFELVDMDDESLCAVNTKPATSGGRNPQWHQTVSVPLPVDVLLKDEDDATKDALMWAKVTILDANRVRNGGGAVKRTAPTL